MIAGTQAGRGSTMGEQNVQQTTDEHTRRAFMKALARRSARTGRHARAGMFESGIRRIGAEQEMFLVDQAAGRH
jgi:hypothetical protein